MTLRARRLALVLITVALPVVTAAQPARPLAVPDDKDLRAATDLLRDEFGKQYALTEMGAVGKRALARRLLEVAPQR
jgi:hypothetical protein